MNVTGPQTWQPLEHIIYGFAIHPLAQSAYGRSNDQERPEDSFSTEGLHPAVDFVARLDVGDEIYAFEKSGEQNAPWYRG